VLSVSGLTVGLDTGEEVLQDISFELRAGEALGLVGESGSGKTTAALALLGYTRSGMMAQKGVLHLQGKELPLDDEATAREVRSHLVSYVPQDPTTSLNPSLRVGASIRDLVGRHVPASAILPALARVRLPATREFARRFPHQLSGGQQQRVLIAAAVAREPALMVFDEPTTGLDMVTQAGILDEIRRLRSETGAAMVYVSHDLAVVSQVTDRIAVMYAGIVVETGPTAQILSEPRHPYTRGLVSSIPDHQRPRALHGLSGTAVGILDRPKGCAFAARCPQAVARCSDEQPALEPRDGRAVACFESHRTPAIDLSGGAAYTRPDTTGDEAAVLVVEHLYAEYNGREGLVQAVKDVSFEVKRGECLALAGESGSGKTTIARVLGGLHPASSGRIVLGGTVLPAKAAKRTREMRRRCQLIFQNPYESLNPRHSVIDEVARPAVILRGLAKRAARLEASELLSRVRLPTRINQRYPEELSGGERQRVAIARALAARPEVLVCDEVTSALDVSVQAAVAELLMDLRSEISLLFITHNLGLVASIADRVVVLGQGRICEEGPVAEVFRDPKDQRTRDLLMAAPTLAIGSPNGEGMGRVSLGDTD